MATEKSVMAVIRSSRPTFRSNSDKISFAVHATLVASGLVLVSTGPPAFSESVLSATSSDEVGIDGWNELDDEYAFVYVDPEKGNKKVLVKSLLMGDKLLVDAVNDGSDAAHLEINIDEYVAENTGNNYNTLYKNLGKLISSLELDVLSRLDGSSKSTSKSGPSSSTPSEGSSTVEVVFQEQHPHDFPQGIAVPPINPLGGSDLYPGPGAGMYPRHGFGGDGGMLLGPDDPSWFGGRGGRPGFPGDLNVPPGARFDPFGPPGVPGFEPSRFTRFPRRPPGGTHPDLQHFGSGNGADYI